VKKKRGIEIDPKTKDLTIYPGRPFKTAEDLWIWLGDQDIVQASELHHYLILYDDYAYQLDDTALVWLLKGKTFTLSYDGKVGAWVDQKNKGHREFMRWYKGG